MPTRPLGVFAGLCTLDVMHDVDTAPAPNQKVTARAQFIAAGGPATNAAVTFSALGGRAVLLTALGRGPAAELVQADLRRYDVRIVDVAAEQADIVPISSIVVSDGGERSIVSVDASGIEIEDTPDLRSDVDGADVVLVDGHHPVLVEAVARIARGAAVPVVLDAGRWRPVMARLLPLVDIAVCSADFRHPDHENTAEALLAAGSRAVVITDGAGPISFFSQDVAGEIVPPSVKAVDTAGAGDVFHGAFCFRMSDGLEPAITFAARTASFACRYPGTRSWIERLGELLSSSSP